jgi:hypothetical protein
MTADSEVWLSLRSKAGPEVLARHLYNGGPVSTLINPYAAPKAAVEDFSANPEAEAIRRAHIGHEASIKSIGILYYLTASLMIVGTVTALFSAWTTSKNVMGMVAILALFGLLSALFFVIGRGLRTLKPWVRVPTTVLAALGLLGFPIGTLLNAYILWLTHSKKGKLILSPEYAAIVEATPDVKYRTSLLIWIILGLIVIALFAALIPMLSR